MIRRMAADAQAQTFTDAHRRVLAHLSHPRSLTSLVRVLDADLSAEAIVAGSEGPEVVSLGIVSADLIERLLDECVAAGWAKNVGDIRKAKELHTVPNADGDVIDVPRASADTLRRRARRHRDRYLDAGDKFILTRAGLGLLTAGLPNEPAPLKGPPLKEALDRNVQIAEDALRVELETEGRTDEQIAAAREVLARQQAARAVYPPDWDPWYGPEDDEDDE